MKVLFAFALTAALALAQNGEALFTELCANCHNGQIDRAPNREILRGYPAERILNALERGVMVTMTARRTSDERRVIAEFAAGKKLATTSPLEPPKSAMCAANPEFKLASGPRWLGWGGDALGTRYVSSPGLKAADVPKLKVKWAFAFPTDLIAFGQPTVANGRLFTGSSSGMVYSLDAATGCVFWFFQAAAGVRGAISLSDNIAFFGDLAANAYAVDVNTGKQLWKTKVDDFPVARITGSPIYNAGRLYVPVASLEEGAGAAPTYECCKFRGSLVALDAFTGKQVWKTYTVEEPRPTTKNKVGTQLYGPSGVPIWSSPIIDTKLNRIYATTGNAYTEPVTHTGDAFIAFDLRDGKIVWVRQLTEQDAYTAACRLADKTNCPEVNGPDYDFASSPMLVTLPNGKRALVAGQKSAVVHAVDPDNQGELLWSTKIGKGGTAGGVQWGSAVDATNVYVALSDIGRVALTYSTLTDADPKAGGGMFALRLTDGKVVWQAKPIPCSTARARCSPAQSQAVTAIPGIAFSGSVDGHFRAYDARNGKVVWDFDTIRDYQTVNGAPGKGGSLDGAGPVIVNGIVYVNSGYPTSGGMPGNVLLAFSVAGK